jgi:Fe-S-cluster containining protein
MAPKQQAPRSGLIQITRLPQFVPSQVCFRCDICCRFPEQDSFLRPYFTDDEIRRAIAGGVDPARFADPAGCQVNVVPNQSGEGYLCPAFDPATAHCRIYEVRPLDCQIYPMAVMWNEDRSKVLLGWDSKCPFMRQSADEGQGTSGMTPEALGEKREPEVPLGHQPAAISHQLLSPDVKAYAERIAGLIEQDETLGIFARHQRLIGPYQNDVVILRLLPRLTERLRGQFNVRSSTFGVAQPRTSNVEPYPLTLADRARLEHAAARQETPLAAYAFAPHVIWRDHFTYEWAEVQGHLCLFAHYVDGTFMPLPPLALEAAASPSHQAFANALARAFAFMRERNRGSAVTRVENVPEDMKPAFETLGYRLTSKAHDYLYRASALANLTGDRYKSQRAACNRFLREHQGRRCRYEPYRGLDRDGCLALYRTWVSQQEARGYQAVDGVARQMLMDAESAHREALTHYASLGLVGMVVRVDGSIRAYTFGYQRSPSVFCVLLEVADRSVSGLAQFTFREFCRGAVGLGYEFINTMDDSGLASLARSKQSYHPLRLVPSLIATEPEPLEGCR